ncbi:transcriptional regulator family: Fungal Specific TF [Purpureocillium lilacinum]|uniref:Transcriptional regulator family: Fungal Specific TF n=1 Tax=Purpureocillium lilacinum TaxID=33203 RepID=A0ABR0BNW1_PURLI|nr:transcriptional regulator family: Fungal Specific TF [Purpureocillium lilacinum]
MVNTSGEDKAPFRRGQQKTGQACHNCHLRKVKCDLVVCGQPPCTRCSELNVLCRRFARKQRKGRLLRAVIESTSIESEGSGSDQAQDNAVGAYPKAFDSLGEGDDPRHLVVTGLGDFMKQSSILVDFLSQDFSRQSINGYQVTFNDNYSSIARILGDEFGRGFEAGIYHHRDAPFVETSQGGLPRTLTAAERGVLELQGAFVLPSQTISDSFVTAFFDRVYPALPIVNRSEFMRRYYTMGSKNTSVSLLLLHSILLAGSTTYQHPDLELPASEISRRLYVRAKALVENRFEQDRLILVQTHLLFSTFASDSCDDTVQNMWLSIGAAARIAQGLGMHRSLGNANAGPPMRRAWKRIWWTLFIHDTLCSFEWGRPRAIHLDDCDVELLEDSDFDLEDTGALPNSEATQFLRSVCDLCFIIGDWLNLLRPGSPWNKSRARDEAQRERESGTRKFVDRLTTWHQGIPASLQPPPALRNFSLWAATLHIAYCATMLRFAALLSDGMETVHVMASQITETCEDLNSHGLLYSLWNFGIHELDLAMGQHARQVNSKNNDTATLALTKLQRGLPLMNLLSERSSVAAQGSAFYEKLVGRAVGWLLAESDGQRGGDQCPHESSDEPGREQPVQSQVTPLVPGWIYDLDLPDFAFSDWVPQTNHPWGWDIVE